MIGEFLFTDIRHVDILITLDSGKAIRITSAEVEWLELERRWVMDGLAKYIASRPGPISLSAKLLSGEIHEAEAQR